MKVKLHYSGFSTSAKVKRVEIEMPNDSRIVIDETEDGIVTAHIDKHATVSVLWVSS